MPSKSSRNAVTHGIHTSVVVLRNENDEFFLNLEDDHVALWNPVGPLESLRERPLRKAQPLPDQQNKTILQNEKDTPSEIRQ